MKSIGLVVASLAMLVVFAGCQIKPPAPPSMNMQKALLNSGGQVATVACLDSSGDPAKRIQETKNITAAIRKLINTGEVSDWTIDQLRMALDKIVPADYQIYVNQIMSCLYGITLPTDKIGPDNIARINEVLDGIDYRCDRYKIAPVPPTVVPDAATTNRGITVKKAARTKAFVISAQ
jgi:hypothetical protein